MISKKIRGFVLLPFFTFNLIISAQSYQGDQLLPVDDKVKIGRLENGFTYYIRQNNKPENRLEMRLAVNAGSIQEDENQRGLAHLVEHMCFNGTLHFEKNELVQYLQSIGMRFGADLNAYTSFDETVYMLTIPSDSTELVEKGFMVMEDWAHNVSFDSAEIDKERGVVIEEWRLGQGPWQRMLDKYLPVVFKDSRYAERLPIGSKDIIEHADYSTIQKFYKDWYRPDLMALIVVGDIDPVEVEKKIKEHFSNLQPPQIIRPRAIYPIPDQTEPLISITTDKEAPVSVVRLMYKSDITIFSTNDDYLQTLRISIITGLLNRRLAELAEKENPPFVGAGFQYGNLARTKNALQGYAVVGENGILNGLDALLTETMRISRFGFTQPEVERMKLDILSQYESSYNERDKTESKQWTEEYTRNYLEEEPIPGIEFEYNFVKNNINQITVDQINDLLIHQMKENNRVVVINAPEKESVIVPTEKQVADVLAAVQTKELVPYQDKLSGEKLMAVMPIPGKIVSEKNIPGLEAYDIQLSNGIRVILKPTNFKNDEVLLSAYSFGGNSLYSEKDDFSARNADGVVQEGGVSKFSNSDLDKLLAGKSVYVAPTISGETENITANSRAVDIETMFQLIYLYFTQPRFDESSFNSYVTKKKDLFENLGKDPQNYFYDKYNRIRSQNNPRGNYLPTSSDWDKINFKRVQEIYIDRFADANNFTFIIVGSFTTDSVKKLLEQYLGSLPVVSRKENFTDLGIRPPKGAVSNQVFKGHDPKSLAILYFEKEVPWNERDAYFIGVLGEVLGYRYIDKLREEMSGVYTFRANAAMSKIPYSKVSLQITIPCSPDNVDSLIAAAVKELKIIQTEGVSESDITKARETRKRQLENAVKTNNFWLTNIQKNLINGTSLDQVTQEKFIDQISSEVLKEMATKYFNTSEFLKVVLYPEEYEEKVQK